MTDSISILRQRSSGLASFPRSHELALPNLRRGATSEEQSVINHIAERDGDPSTLSAGELQDFNRELIAAAGEDSRLDSDEWAAVRDRAGLVQVDARQALGAAFLTTMRADAMRTQATASVRHVEPGAWKDQRTTRAAYFCAEDVVAYGRGETEVLERFLDNLQGSDINAVVVDIKEGGGWIYIDAPGGDSDMARLMARAVVSRPASLQDMVDALHRRGLKVIARQVVFKDERFVSLHPEAAIQDSSGGAWGNRKMWVNPWHPDARAYNIEIARRALAVGADEIQFDYIRFPDRGQGDRTRASYPNRPSGEHYCDAIVGFLSEARAQLKSSFPAAKIGADVFGYVASGRNVRDSLGQDVGEMSRYLDVLWPMQYPSHWAQRGSSPFGSEHPETQPDTVYRSTTRGLIRQLPLHRRDQVEIRPWLQAFTMQRFGGLTMEEPSWGDLGSYVDRQVDGLESSDANGYALWGSSWCQGLVFSHQRRTNEP